MKKMKNIILPLFLAFLSVVLVACSANKDNGTYLYEPTKEEISKLVTGSGLSKENFVSLLGDDFKLSLSLTIDGDKGVLTFEGNVAGVKNNQNYDLKVNQAKKTLQPAPGGTEVPYKISGDELMIDLSSVDSREAANLTLLKNVVFKRQNK